MNYFMEKANEAAKRGIDNNQGGPFGAVVVDKDNNIVSVGNNEVLSRKDPTAHAEIIAIRKACKKLDTYDLENYVLYTTCEPCPMCLSAIIWSNIKSVYYGCTREDANKIGFKDKKIYDYLKGNKDNLITMIKLDREECLKNFEEYKKKNGIIY